MLYWAHGGGGLGMGSESELSAEVALRISGSGRVCDSSDRETKARRGPVAMA